MRGAISRDDLQEYLAALSCSSVYVSEAKDRAISKEEAYHGIIAIVDNLEGSYDGALEDCNSAVEVLIRRIKGDADLESAAEWVRLNYPAMAATHGLIATPAPPPPENEER